MTQRNNQLSRIFDTKHRNSIELPPFAKGDNAYGIETKILHKDQQGSKGTNCQPFELPTTDYLYRKIHLPHLNILFVNFKAQLLP
jgi:hypothetical protein